MIKKCKLAASQCGRSCISPKKACRMVASARAGEFLNSLVEAKRASGVNKELWTNVVRMQNAKAKANRNGKTLEQVLANRKAEPPKGGLFDSVS